MSDLVLSRLRLRRDPPVAALAGLLVPGESHARMAAAHRLVWALFTDGAERRRDFLWREEAPGRFLALSRRPPNPLHELFEIESQPFAPVLSKGDRLGFALRANAVVSRRVEGQKRGRRADVVMDALFRLPKGEARREARAEAVQVAGRAWLARQGATHGFEPEGEVGVDGYDSVRLARDEGAPIRFGVLDFQGVLTVTDPPRFLGALERGLGHARAFGCGLLLIRRAR